MSGGGSKVTVGYKYFLGSHMVLCHGPIDAVLSIEVDRRVAWEGVADENEVITVSAPNLFGGDGREGGVSGDVSFLMGGADQLPDSYLIEQLGTDIPASRGVVSAVLRQTYMGNNPYLKPWAFNAVRVETTSNGEEQWYLAKAAIIRADCPCDELEGAPGFLGYLVSPNADPTWDEWFPITNVVAQTGSTVLSDFNPPSVDYIEIAETADAGDVFNPCDGAPLTVFTLDSTGLLRYVPPSTTNTAFVWGIKSGDTPLLFNPLIGEGNIRILDAGGTPRGAGTTIVVGLDEVGSPPYTQFEITIDASNARDVGDTNTGPSSTSDTYGPYTTNALAADNLNSWTLSSLELFADVDNRFNDGVWIYIPTTITVRIAWNGGDNTAVITKNIEWRYGTSASGTPDAASIDFMNIGKNGGRIAAAGADGSGLSAEQFSSILDSWLANQVGEDPCLLCTDMNPAHIIRECLTDNVWGMGYNDGDVDEDAFRTAADILYDESMGISILWEREMPIEDFIGEILRHIDAVLYVSRRTGKFVLKLIRDEEVDSQTVVLDESNVSAVQNASRPTISELTNALSVVYWNFETDENASLTVHNNALRQIQGAEISTTVQYPGFTNKDIAARVADRDLKALSIPLLSCEITANRDAADLNLGDIFVLDWPDLEIGSMVMRVNEMDYGDGVDNSIKITAIEDVFDISASSVQESQPSLWVDPDGAAPLAPVVQANQEAPYWVLVQTFGESVVDDELALVKDAGFPMFSAGRQAAEINATITYDVDSTGQVRPGLLDFHPYAYLAGPIGYTDTEVTILNGVDLGLVDTFPPLLAQIGDEFVRVDSVVNDSNGIPVALTIGRGVLDTVPTKHEASSSLGIPIAILGDFYQLDRNSILAGETAVIRLLTNTGSGQLAPSDAATESVTFNSRAIRPYPPGDLKIDGLSYPDSYAWDNTHTITWAHRDRTQQTDQNLYDYTAGDIGPEAGTSYVVEVFAIVGDSTEDDSNTSERETVKIYESNVGSSTSEAIDLTSGPFDSNSDQPPDNTYAIRVQVRSVRDGYDSWQAASVELQYPPFTDSVG
jgi:hypothetical protein